MDVLSLFITNSYILGMVCGADCQPRPVALDNREDRIWLYFHNEKSDNSVSFGSGNREKCKRRQSEYISDIFARMIDSEAKFSYYGRDTDLKDIWEDAGVFAQLKKNFNTEDAVPVYISFDESVNAYAASRFVELMKKNGFEVKSDSLGLESLAIEKARKLGLNLSSDEVVLLLSAIGDDMRVGVIKDGKPFNPDDLHILSHCGNDVRIRSLAETIVEKADTNHFLTSEEDRQGEYVLLYDEASEWLRQMDNSPLLNLPGFSLIKAPNNKSNVLVGKEEIEKRTSVIVKSLVNAIVKEYEKDLSGNQGVTKAIFIGDDFSNQELIQTLQSQLPIQLDGADCKWFKDEEMKDIVSCYPDLDLSQYGGLNDRFAKRSEEAQKCQKKKEEEREAERRGLDTKKSLDEQEKIENEYNNAVQKAQDYERLGQFSDMRDMAQIALSKKPGDKQAMDLLTQATEGIAVQKTKADVYKNSIQRADQCYADKDWQNALLNYTAALDADPNASYAKDRVTDVQRRLGLQQKIKDYLSRADVFIAQKDYAHALDELQKALVVDSDDETVKSRKKEVEDLKVNLGKEVDSLKSQMEKAVHEGKFDDALDLCNRLANADASNVIYWNGKKTEVEDARRKAEEYKRKIDQLFMQLRQAESAGDQLNEVTRLCNTILGCLSPDDVRLEDVKARLATAEQKMQEQERKKKYEEFQTYVAEVNREIAAGNEEAARSKMTQLQKQYAGDEYQNVYHDLNKRIFAIGFFSASPSTKAPAKNTSDSSSNNKVKPQSSTVDSNKNKKSQSATDDDDFFADSHKNKKSQPVEDDDFFADEKKSSKNKGENGKHLTNDDFNF